VRDRQTDRERERDRQTDRQNLDQLDGQQLPRDIIERLDSSLSFTHSLSLPSPLFLPLSLCLSSPLSPHHSLWLPLSHSLPFFLFLLSFPLLARSLSEPVDGDDKMDRSREGERMEEREREKRRG
jgi:hypothetical protein